jgi:hypothetical protein
MYTQSRIAVDAGVAEQVIKLYKDLDNARGGRYGTWHSRRIRANPYGWFAATFDRVAAEVGDLQIDEWWFNCGEPGDEYRWHAHTPYSWSGVLYIQTPTNSGAIEFRQGESHETVQPSAGDFLLFPGNLAHRVLKNNSTDFRISVAFNFLHK